MHRMSSIVFVKDAKKNASQFKKMILKEKDCDREFQTSQQCALFTVDVVKENTNIMILTIYSDKD